MEPRKDIRLTKDYINANNDVEYYLSDQQHIQDTIISYPLEWKEHPLDGVGVNDFLNSSGQQLIIARKIFLQLKSDLFTCKTPIVSYNFDGTLNINPNAAI